MKATKVKPLTNETLPRHLLFRFTNAIVLMQDAVNMEMRLILIISILVICIITYLVLIAASPIMKVFGETGNKIMLRLVGLIVVVIGAEFFFAGLKPFVKEMMK